MLMAENRNCLSEDSAENRSGGECRLLMPMLMEISEN